MSFSMGGNRPLVRWQPKMETHKYRTFSMQAPLDTHYRPATCREVDCAAYQNGWSFDKSVLSPANYYKVTHAGKRYREVNLGPGMTYLVFEAGQFCFDKHSIRLPRPEIYLVGRGDWRSFQPHHAKQIKRADEFAERMVESQLILQEEIKKG